MNIQIFGSSKCFDTKKAAHQVPVYRPAEKGLLVGGIPLHPAETDFSAIGEYKM